MIDVPHLWAKDVWIEIENKDNPPLEIASIQCRQLKSYLIGDLKASQNYTLSYGNWALKVPEYDINHFTSQIPERLPEARLSESVQKNTVILPIKPKEIAIFETKSFLWLCLGVIAIVILLFSRSLLKDMGKQ